MRAVSGCYERAAARLGKPRPRAGAVAFIQRFDLALRRNVHLHVLWLDGVYSQEPGRSDLEWCEHAQVTDADVAQIVRRVGDRVQRKLRQMGKWSEAGDAADTDAAPDASDGEQLLLALDSTDFDGFSLHAAVRVAAGNRRQLEHLCRYAGRPAVAESRLSLLPDGVLAPADESASLRAMVDA